MKSACTIICSLVVMLFAGNCSAGQMFECPNDGLVDITVLGKIVKEDVTNKVKFTLKNVHTQMPVGKMIKSFGVLPQLSDFLPTGFETYPIHFKITTADLTKIAPQNGIPQNIPMSVDLTQIDPQVGILGNIPTKMEENVVKVSLEGQTLCSLANLTNIDPKDAILHIEESDGEITVEEWEDSAPTDKYIDIFWGQSIDVAMMG